MAHKKDPFNGPPPGPDPKDSVPDSESTGAVPEIGSGAGGGLIPPPPPPNFPPGGPLYPDHDIGRTARQPEISDVNQPIENPGRDFGHPFESEGLDVQGDFGDTSTSKLVPLRREEQAAEKEARLNSEDAPLSRFSKGDRGVLDDVIRRQDEDAAAAEETDAEETEGEGDPDSSASDPVQQIRAAMGEDDAGKAKKKQSALSNALDAAGDEGEERDFYNREDKTKNQGAWNRGVYETQASEAYKKKMDSADAGETGGPTDAGAADAGESGGQTDAESSDSDKDESKAAMGELVAAINGLSESVKLNTGAVDVLKDQTEELAAALTESMEGAV